MHWAPRGLVTITNNNSLHETRKSQRTILSSWFTYFFYRIKLHDAIIWFLYELYSKQIFFTQWVKTKFPFPLNVLSPIPSTKIPAPVDQIPFSHPYFRPIPVPFYPFRTLYQPSKFCKLCSFSLQIPSFRTCGCIAGQGLHFEWNAPHIKQGMKINNFWRFPPQWRSLPSHRFWRPRRHRCRHPRSRCSNVPKSTYSWIPDKRVGTRSKFSPPPPPFNVDNQVIFSLFVGKNAIFSNID